MLTLSNSLSLSPLSCHYISLFVSAADLESLCSTERIGLIQERMKAIQKRYMELKSEVTYLDRKRRRARRREREGKNIIINEGNF